MWLIKWFRISHSGVTFFCEIAHSRLRDLVKYHLFYILNGIKAFHVEGFWVVLVHERCLHEFQLGVENSDY